MYLDVCCVYQTGVKGSLSFDVGGLGFGACLGVKKGPEGLLSGMCAPINSSIDEYIDKYIHKYLNIYTYIFLYMYMYTRTHRWTDT